MKTTQYFTTNTKDNMAFALALAAAAIGLAALFTNNANAHVAATANIQTLDTIVVTAPRIHTVQLETIVVTASRNMNADNIIVAAK
jgi:outer membrane receptor protein involved in Fe transport